MVHFMNVWLTQSVLLVAVKSSSSILAEKGLPCHFYDSVNITGGTKCQNNNSIIFNGIEFPDGHYATVNHIFNGSARILAKSHIRGCPCLEKPCLTLCCPFGSFVETKQLGEEQEELVCREDESAKNIQISIYDEHNQSNTIDLAHHFGLVNRICPNRYYADEPKVYKTGNVSHFDGISSYRDYCLNFPSNYLDDEFFVMICMDDSLEDISNYTQIAYAMLVSVVFLVITFLVYILNPEKRKTKNSKLILCYSFSLALSFALMSWIKLNGRKDVGIPIKKAIAIITYFSFMTATLWSHVLSFDIWRTFRDVLKNRKNRIKWYFYVIYAGGLPLLLTVIGIILDSIDSVPDFLKPGFGVETIFLKESNHTTKYIYLIAPIFIVFSSNIVFFILTVSNILQHDQQLTTNFTSSSRYRKQKHEFCMCLRLFTMMGAFWIMEALGYMFNDLHPDSTEFLETLKKVFDFCNALHGLFIFALFVIPDCMKKTKCRLRSFKNGRKNSTNSMNMSTFRTTLNRTNTTPSVCSMIYPDEY